MPTAWRSRRAARPARNSAALPYSASARTHPKRAPETNTRSISSSAIAHFGRYATVPGTPAAARRVASPLQSSGRNRRRPTPTGTSARAKVSETRAWQLARLPSWPPYWRLTPTEWRARLPPGRVAPDRVAALLHQGRVVHDQDRIRPADQPVGGLDQLVLERRGRPGRGGDEMVQLLGVGRRYPCRHRLHALALAGQEQALEVDRRPAPLRLAPQPLQERLEPALQLILPAFRQ